MTLISASQTTWLKFSKVQGAAKARCLAVVLCILGAVSFATAATDVGFASLNVGIGSREWGMGMTGAASALGPHSMYWNPGLNGWNGRFGNATPERGPQPSFQADVSYSAWFQGMGKTALFVTRPTPLFVLGLGVSSFSAGSIEYRPDKPTDDPSGYYSPLDYNVYLNLSRALLSQLSVGVSGRFYYEKVSDLSASGVGLDAGAVYRPISHLNLGLAVNDFGTTMKFHYGDVSLPTRGSLGVSYDLPLGRSELTAAADFGYGFYSQDMTLGIGAEFVPSEVLALRAGYRVLGATTGLTAGIGLKVKGIRIEYSIGLHDNDLGATHQLALGYGY